MQMRHFNILKDDNGYWLQLINDMKVQHIKVTKKEALTYSLTLGLKILDCQEEENIKKQQKLNFENA